MPFSRGGAGFGGGGSSSIRLGPAPNVFTQATLAAAEAQRDAFAGDPANAAWLAEYAADKEIYIVLEYDDAGGDPVAEYQSYDSVISDWRDIRSYRGLRGLEGKSAYQSWLDAGNTGTEADFVDSLEGKSAYQSWLDAGNVGTEADFLADLVGPPGTPGTPGNDGLSVRAFYINSATEPAAPTGTALPPTGWTATPATPTGADYTWACYTYAASLTAVFGNGVWSPVLRVTGRDGISGGSYRVVTTLADRDAIPAGERAIGLHVFVTFEDKEYYLSGGVSNSDWVEVTFGGGGDGSYRVVPDIAQRNAIPTADRKEGLHVYVVSAQEVYYLHGGISNSDWLTSPQPMYRIVQNGTERDAIPAGERQEGMLVYLRSNDKTFQLGAGLTNSDWMNVLSKDYTWSGNHQFNTDVKTLGKFVGIGAIDQTDQAAGRVLTATSGTEGDYTWSDLPAGAVDKGYHVVADQAALLALPLTEIQDGTRVRVVADNKEYINLLGFNRTIADWKDILSYDTTFTSQVRIEDHKLQLGFDAGKTNQGDNAVALGPFAGMANQGEKSIAIGDAAGHTDQGEASIAIGDDAGELNQSDNSIAIGTQAGELNQSEDAISIGNQAGMQGQGFDSIAIGHEAGKAHQGNRGIIINSSGTEKNLTTDGHLGIYTAGSHPLEIEYEGGVGKSLTINQSTEITGDLTVTGTINGATGGGVQNYRIVSNEAARDAIPTGERVEGMAVFVQDTNIGYVLIDGTTNADWKRNSPQFISVNDIAERDVIPATWRFEGLHVYVIAEDTTYRLLGGLTNTSWVISNDANMLIAADDAERLAIHSDVLRVGTHVYQLDDMEMYINTTATNVGGEINWQKFNDLDITYGGDVTFTGDVLMNGDFRSTNNEIHVGFGAGQTNQGNGSVAVGSLAGQMDQGANSVAMGFHAATTSQGNNAVSIGDSAGTTNQSNGAVAVGRNSGNLEQGQNSLALGSRAGQNNQGDNSISIGYAAGMTDQGDNSILINGTGATMNNTNDGALEIATDVVTIRHDGDAGGNLRINQVVEPQGLLTNGGVQVTGTGSFVGTGAVPTTGQQPAYVLTANSITAGDYEWKVAPGGGGFDTTADYTVTGDWEFHGDARYFGSKVHWGTGSGETGQGAFGIAVGHEAGQTNQGLGAIAFGNLSGQTSQGQHSLAAGNQAGQLAQGEYSLAVGDNAGSARQGSHALAVGRNAGQQDQGQDASAVGENAGNSNQGQGAIAYGKNSGQTRQGLHSIALGTSSGNSDMGDNAIAIGNQAGTVNQGANSIVFNSSGASVSNTHANSFTVHTGELSIDFNGTSTDHLTINKEIDVTDITITSTRLITGVPI